MIAHELGHIKNRDTLTMTITATLAGAIGFLSQFAFFFGRDSRNPLGMLGTILTMILAPLAAMLVQMAISRTREYLGRPQRRRDLRPAAGARQRAAEDRAPRARRRQPGRRAQPGLGPSVHHQSVAHGRDRQPVPHPPADRRAGRAPAGAGGRGRAGERRGRPLAMSRPAGPAGCRPAPDRPIRQGWRQGRGAPSARGGARSRSSARSGSAGSPSAAPTGAGAGDRSSRAGGGSPARPSG